MWSGVKVFGKVVVFLSSPKPRCHMCFDISQTFPAYEVLPGSHSSRGEPEFCCGLVSWPQICQRNAAFPSTMKCDKLQETNTMFRFRMGIRCPPGFCLWTLKLIWQRNFKHVITLERIQHHNLFRDAEVLAGGPRWRAGCVWSLRPEEKPSEGGKLG